MSLKSDIISALAITWLSALMALTARIFARRMTKVSLWYDDYFCVGAFVRVMRWYLGTTIPDTVTTEKYKAIDLNARLMQFLISLTYSYSIGLSKLSILLFYWRIFRQSAIRISIQIMLIISVAWVMIRTLMVIFHCMPVQAYWDKSIKNATCKINDTRFFFSTCLTHFIIDIIILALPVIEVFKLRLSLGQKFAITAMFARGGIVCLASMFVSITALQYDPKSAQMPRDVARNDMWGCVEVNIAIVSGCFPLLRPIFTKILPKISLSRARRMHPTSRTTRCIRLTAINNTKGKDVDDNSSTYRLADPEQGVPRSFERIEGKEGLITLVSSPTTDSLYSRPQERTGIYVRSDVMQEVEVSDSMYAMQRH
ncbi:hypothetical protein ACKAV7_012047 [Fusarium commune]